MDIFDHASGLTFHDSNFTQIRAQHSFIQVVNYGKIPERRNLALETLRHHARIDATHNSGERIESPRCYPGTRLAVLREIARWIQGRDQRRASRCLWLSGAAGSGKTAVAQTLAERCYDQGTVVLSYFLSRSLSGIEQIQAVIHTIAHQLCAPPSTLSQYILQAIHDDPTIFSKGVKLQMEQLIIRPFREACQTNPFLRFTTRAVIIDGLDSCGTVKEQQLLFSLFMDAITQNDLPLHLFITSRPEPHIPPIFDKYPNCVKQVVLDATFSPRTDITLFVRSSFTELMSGRYPATDGSWFLEADIVTIVEKSSDQFLYASDVVTYVCATPNGAETRLQEVTGTRKDHYILPRVDAIFEQLLESVEPHHQDMVLDTFAWMAIYGGFIPATYRITLSGSPDFAPFSFPWLARMLGRTPSEIFEAFNTLWSLFEVPDRAESQQPLRSYHASLFEFLSNETRAGGEFFMDEAVAHGRIAQCMGRHFCCRAVGAADVLGAGDRNELKWMEAVFRCHLVQARPSEGLVESVEWLALKGSSWQAQQASSRIGPTIKLDITSVYTFTCDTKRTIVCFLTNYYESRTGKETYFRLFILRRRLAIFSFFKIFLKKTCGKPHCSCAAGRVDGFASPELLS